MQVLVEVYFPCGAGHICRLPVYIRLWFFGLYGVYSWTKVMVGTLLGTTKEAAEMFDIFVQHKLKVVKTIFTLDQVNELVKTYESGDVSGKLVVKF